MKTHTIDEYRQIEADVWKFFKKYFDTDDYSEYVKDATALDTKYKKDVRQYCFYLELMRVHGAELEEIRKLREKRNEQTG